jgi:GT2 family glycosyltransferase
MVDIGNRKESLALFEQYKTMPRVRYLQHSNSTNYSDALNFAVSETNTEFVIFLHDDIEIITRDWLEIMLGFAQRKETGAVGVKLLHPNRTIQMAGVFLDEGGKIRSSHNGPPGEILGYGGRILSTHNVPAVLAVCMMVRREVFDNVGGFDARFPEIYTDIDFCLRLREKNYLIVYVPHAEVCHYGPLPLSNVGTSDKLGNFGKEAQVLFKKWEHVLSNKDPYYNINLGFHKVILSEKVLS